MNTTQIAIKALTAKRDAAQAQVNNLNIAISALSDKAVPGNPSIQNRRRRVGKGAGATQPRKPAKSAANGADSPELQSKLRAISARTDLTPIQKAQESRKVRAQFKHNTPTRPEGAVLGEAAAAEA